LGIRHLFQGQLWTQETGLNDYRNRVELPVMGVFLQPDPIGFNGDAANIYRFCNNNAVNRSDPMGLVDTNASIWNRQMWLQGGSFLNPDQFDKFRQGEATLSWGFTIEGGAPAGNGKSQRSQYGAKKDVVQAQSETDYRDWRDAGLAGGYKAWAKTDHSGLGGEESFEYGGLILKHRVEGRWMYNYNGVFKGKHGPAGGMHRANFLQVGRLPIPDGWTRAGWYYSHPIRGDTISQFDKEVADQNHWVGVGFAPQVNRTLTGPMIEFYPNP
jgi:RHS repeat-associated protein